MNRSTKFLVGLFVVLGAFAYLMLPSNKERETSYKTAELSIKIDSASVVKIDIQQPAKSVTLENVGGTWMVTAPLRATADPNAVKQLISGMVKFKVGSLISSNPEKQNLYQVDATGTKLTVSERAGKSMSLILGKTGPTYSETYFRLPESKDVYLGEGVESWVLNKEVKDWREKTILVTSRDSIQSLSYMLGNKEYAFQHDSTGWQSGGKTVDVNTMNPVLNTVTNLRADDFADTAVTMNTRPVTLKIHGSEDITLQMSPIPPDSARYYISSSSTPQLFIISKYTAQQLMKPIEQPKK